MKSFEERQQRWETKREKWQQKWEKRHRSRHSRIWVGVLFVIIGTAALLKALAVPMPGWLFSWPMLLIVIGFFSGLRKGFRAGGWPVLMLVGGIFLVGKIDSTLSVQPFIWPAVLILLGLMFILKPRRKSRWAAYHECFGPDEPQTVYQEAEPVKPAEPGPESASNRSSKTGSTGNASREDYVDFTSVFGGIEKTIFSKDFRGGDIVNIFGGTHLNLSQADIQQPVTLDMVQIFGGTNLVVPPDWDVKSEMTAIFGGVEDKRSNQQAPSPDKVLILKGTSIFGGIELKSF